MSEARKAVPPRPMREFAQRLVAWQRRHGRHDLPWQATRDPYRVWLSEIMLQQTRVGTVVPYYERFLARFPDAETLARATLDEVLREWAGLGYYSRARNLHRAAQAVCERHGGKFPPARALLEALPGLGRSTAAAVAVFAFGAREAILDGNVKRVLARHFAVDGYPGKQAVERKLWTLAESLLPARDIEAYTQGLMDLGAKLCTRGAPACERCPLASSCVAFGRGRVAAYPAPRPRKKLALRSVAMLLVVRDGEVLLEKRPPTGVWGGLWSLPEMPVGGAVAAHAAERLGCEIAEPIALQPLRHTFTHFALEIRPWRCEVRGARLRAAQPATIWLGIDEAMRAAVPAPVKKLLGRIGERE